MFIDLVDLEIFLSFTLEDFLKSIGEFSVFSRGGDSPGSTLTYCYLCLLRNHDPIYILMRKSFNLDYVVCATIKMKSFTLEL